jgi:hypothetical protein
MADHCEVSQLMSFALVNAAHGCLDVSRVVDLDLPAEEDDNSVALCWDKPKHKDVFAATVIACCEFLFQTGNVHSGTVSPNVLSLCSTTSLCLALTR